MFDKEDQGTAGPWLESHHGGHDKRAEYTGNAIIDLVENWGCRSFMSPDSASVCFELLLSGDPGELQ